MLRLKRNVVTVPPSKWGNSMRNCPILDSIDWSSVKYLIAKQPAAKNVLASSSGRAIKKALFKKVNIPNARRAISKMFCLKISLFKESTSSVTILASFLTKPVKLSKTEKILT